MKQIGSQGGSQGGSNEVKTQVSEFDEHRNCLLAYQSLKEVKAAIHSIAK